jgi:4-carboxymuconolactone decarboxylase
MSRTEDVEQLLVKLAEVSEMAPAADLDTPFLDARTRALVIVGAAVCTNAPTRTFKALVASAIESGATSEEVVGAMLAVAPAAGESKIVMVAPKVALALGYDIDAAFENE